MFDVFRNRLELTGTLWTVTALRVSQGRSLEPIGADLPVVKDALGRPLIPGSSFKGVLRSRLESFLRGILGNDRKLVANPAIEGEWSLNSIEIKVLKDMDLDELVIFCWAKEQPEFQVFCFEDLAKLIKLNSDVKAGKKRPEPQDLENLNKLSKLQDLENLKKQYSAVDAALTTAIAYETDLISKLFGSPWVSSKFQVQELTVLSESWFGQYQERDGVSIDRDTETAAEGKLYDFQVVPAGTPFKFKAIVENAEDWELGLLMIGLHQFETEQIPLGGGRSRGLGVVRLELSEKWWFDYPDNRPEELITYLRRLINNERDHYQLNDDQYQSHKLDWTEALLSKLNAATQRQAEAQPIES